MTVYLYKPIAFFGLLLISSVILAAPASFSIDRVKLTEAIRDHAEDELVAIFEKIKIEGNTIKTGNLANSELIKSFVNNNPKLKKRLKELKKQGSVKLRAELKKFGLHKIYDDYAEGKSKAVISDLKSQYDKAKNQLNSILNIKSELEAAGDDAEAYADVLVKFGVSGEKLKNFKSLEKRLKAIKDRLGKHADKWEAFQMVYQGMNGTRPSSKIKTLFSLLSTYGGKVPILGTFVELYGQVALEMINATERLNKIFAEREGGCIGQGIHSSSDKNLIFNKHYSGSKACPIITYAATAKLKQQVSGIENIFIGDYPESIRGHIFWWKPKTKSFARYVGIGSASTIAKIHELIKQVAINNPSQVKVGDMQSILKLYQVEGGFEARYADAIKTKDVIKQRVRKLYTPWYAAYDATDDDFYAFLKSKTTYDHYNFEEILWGKSRYSYLYRYIQGYANGKSGAYKKFTEMANKLAKLKLAALWGKITADGEMPKNIQLFPKTGLTIVPFKQQLQKKAGDLSYNYLVIVTNSSAVEVYAVGDKAKSTTAYFSQIKEGVYRKDIGFKPIVVNISVLDKAGEPISGAVIVASPLPAIKTGNVTSGSGSLRMKFGKSGHYSFKVTHFNFHEQSRTLQVTEDGSQLTFNLRRRKDNKETKKEKEQKQELKKVPGTLIVKAIDSITGKLVPGSIVEYAGKRYEITNDGAVLSLKTDKKVALIISADGYKTRGATGKVAAGKQKTYIAKLVSSTGKLRISIKDAVTNQLIDKATVRIDGREQKIFGGTKSFSITADKQVLIIIAAEGYAARGAKGRVKQGENKEYIAKLKPLAHEGSLAILVVNAESGKPVPKAVIKIDGKIQTGDGNGAATLLLPADKIVSLVISAPGYHVKKARGRVAAGESKTYVSKLMPVDDKPKEEDVGTDALTGVFKGWLMAMGQKITGLRITINGMDVNGSVSYNNNFGNGVTLKARVTMRGSYNQEKGEIKGTLTGRYDRVEKGSFADFGSWSQSFTGTFRGYQDGKKRISGTYTATDEDSDVGTFSVRQ